MGSCKECIYYDDENSHPGTGFCEMWEDFVKEHGECEEFEEK